MQTIKLNLIPGSVLPVVNVSQYDVGRHFALQVYEGASAYDLTGKGVQIRGTKPDGNGFAYDSTDGAISVSTNTVTVTTLQQMTAVGGQTMAELRITSGETILGTINFILDVEHSALSDDTPISETEIPVIERQLEELVEEIQVYTEDAEAWAVGERDGEPVPSSDPTYHNNAKYYASNALSSASTATTKAGEAAASATNAGNSATTASNAATTATTKAGEASTSATNAATSAGNASDSADAASGSAQAASDSADDAADSADDSEAYANGTRGGSDVPSTDPTYHNNAKYWRDQAASYAAGGIHFMGSIPFSDIPTVGMANGDEYNITNDFVTDSRFVEGAGLFVKAGTNIAWAMSAGKWDVLATGGGAETLGDLSDTSISSPADGQALVYNNTTQKWENRTVSTVGDLDDLGDVDLTTPTSGQVLKFDGSKWVNGNGGGGASDLDDLGDVTITTPTDGQVLTYDAASQKWVNANGGGGGGGFDYKAWLTAGDLNPMAYADLAAVLADENAVRKLMTIHTAVDYLASQDLGADVLTILSDNLCAKWINLRDYALDTLYGNQVFAPTMDQLGKYGYGEWAKLSESPETWGPKGNVPIMTSNTAPYGVASAYQVFDGNNATTASGTDFNYKFVNPVCVKDFVVKDGSGNAITGGTLQASNDGSTWVTPVADTFYIAWNVHFGSSTTVGTVQFYGRELKPLVPTMTGNTTPKGEAFASNAYAEYYPWKAFDGKKSAASEAWAYYNSGGNVYPVSVGYDFKRDVLVKYVVGYNRGDGSQTYAPKTFKVQGYSNNEWVDLTDAITNANSSQGGIFVSQAINTNDVTCEKCQLYITDGFNNVEIMVQELQFYGFDYSEYDWDADNPRHYLYDHGVELEDFENVNSENNWSYSGTSFKSNSTKLPYALYIAPAGTGYIDGFGTGATINLTSYDLFRIVADPTGTTDDCLRGYFSATKAIDNSLAHYYLSSAKEGAFDISSIAQSVYISEISQNKDNRYGYIYEMWLE